MDRAGKVEHLKEARSQSKENAAPILEELPRITTDEQPEEARQCSQKRSVKKLGSSMNNSREKINQKSTLSKYSYLVQAESIWLQDECRLIWIGDEIK